ncbi:hypothetical protein M5689_004736 [Euphorbia peplus]|nr:hypothetical protein M5689_004736 [Euphorbia peplus]
MEKGKTEINFNRERDDDQDEVDEEKVEEFFALIKSFQEARNRRKDEVILEEEERLMKRKKVRRLNDEKPSWIPCFQWEDFTDHDIKFRTPPVILPRREEDKNDDGLDLKLAL